MPAPIYSRFVPPKPAIRDPASSSPQPAASPTPAAHSKKEKKSKKRSHDELAQPVEDAEVISDAVQDTAQDVAYPSPSSNKKPKKRKRDSAVNDAIEDTEGSPKKHKSILSKFEKVSKKAREHTLKRQEAGEESDDAPAREQPVLRGRYRTEDSVRDTDAKQTSSHFLNPRPFQMLLSSQPSPSYQHGSHSPLQSKPRSACHSTL